MTSELITLPAATTTFAQAGTWSTQVGTEFFLIVLVGAGLIIGGMLVSYFIGKVVGGAKRALGKGRRGGRRRR